VDDLFKLAIEIVPYFMAHNAETDACDLLMEIDRLDYLLDVVESSTYQRVCIYLTR
jgi:26S proteasome regulatory subunit N1